MDEELDNEEYIDIYSANFKYNNNDEQIKELYEKNQIVESNDVIYKKIIKKKYNHPLFLNYNYCFFCLERRKTKYNQKNLDDQHKNSDLKSISLFLKEKNIQLNKPINKNEKLSKRRFIHSLDNKEKEINLNNKYSESDTELYIEDIEKINKAKKNPRKSIINRQSSQFSNLLTINSNKSNNYTIKRSKSKSIELGLRKTRTLNNHSNSNNLLRHKSQSNHDLTDYKNTSIYKRREKKLETTQRSVKNFSFFDIIVSPFNTKKYNETNDFFMETIDEGETQYYEKNEKCEICLDEIKDKFTLFCGDFFCKECIVNLIKESINNISIFGNLSCPRCHEPINENTIKFLLKGSSLKKYEKMKMRINGLKDKRNIPCPHPDCEGFSNKEKLKNDTYECQNNHVFCKKCLEEINPKYRKNKKKKHICTDKYPETEEYLKNNKNIRKCPNCQCWVERESAPCNYFKCSNLWCQYEFCWLCGNKYEPNHYKNPLSTCFNLAESDYQGKFLKSNRIRRIRCILIILLFILIILPIICIFFSFFLIFFFVMYFQLDGKELRNIRIHSKIAHKIFYKIFFSFIFLIALALIPLGYICLSLLIIAIPIIIIIKKIRKKKEVF